MTSDSSHTTASDPAAGALPGVDNQAAQAIAVAPLPTDKTLRARRSLVVQLWRFVVLNLRMMKMVRKGHD